MKVYEKIWLEPQRFTVHESYDEADDSLVGVKMRGRAIKADTPTRNGVAYTADSLQRFCEVFNKSGKTIPMLDTHNDTSIRTHPPFGHIERLFMEGAYLMYEADIDPEEKTFLHKCKRGDIREVSIQAVVDQVDERVQESGDHYIVAAVRELLEISPVTIPGSQDSSMQFFERLGVRGVTKENLHTYEKKFGLPITERRLVEKFRTGLYTTPTTEALRLRSDYKELKQERGVTLAAANDEFYVLYDDKVVWHTENLTEAVTKYREELPTPTAHGDIPDEEDEETSQPPTRQQPTKQDLSTGNAGGLMVTALPKDKKIRPAAETLLQRSRLLKVVTHRFPVHGRGIQR